MKFTWCNNQESMDKVYCKLDRVVANPAWLESFGEFILNLEGWGGGLDHAISITYLRAGERCSKSSFRYLNMWQKH